MVQSCIHHKILLSHTFIHVKVGIKTFKAFFFLINNVFDSVVGRLIIPFGKKLSSVASGFWTYHALECVLTARLNTLE